MYARKFFTQIFIRINFQIKFLYFRISFCISINIQTKWNSHLYIFGWCDFTAHGYFIGINFQI